MKKTVELVRRALPLLVFAGALGLYLRTLAPSVAELFDDSLEFQLVGYKLAIAHPTGYPLYTLLLKAFTLLPIGEVAGRTNLSSAVLAALAVALVYGSARRLTGSVLPALAAAATLAVSPVFWSQAVITEVYALNAVLIAAATLVLLGGRDGGADREVARRDEKMVGQAERDAEGVGKLAGRGELAAPSGKGRAATVSAGGAGRDLTWLALIAGLMLAHHRTGVLLLPAAALYLWLADGRDWRVWLKQIFTRRTAVAALLPLALYAYLPLRGNIGSLDGSYENTPQGFVNWILASGYNIFLTGNPFNEHYDAAFFVQLFAGQFGWLGLGLALLGLGWLLKRRLAAGVFLLAAFATYLIFVLNYHVPDVQVFAIPAFLMIALMLGCGLHALITEVPLLVQKIFGQPPLESRPDSTHLPQFVAVMLMLLSMIPIFTSAFATNDLSERTELRDYGRDMLAQPLPPNAALVGILGEMTLVRYLQAAEGLQPGLRAVAADRDAERLAAIERELAAGNAVFTTRLLNGLPEKYALAALGPLVRVLPQPQQGALAADAARVGDIKFRVDGIEQHGASVADDDVATRFVRVNVAWEPTAPINTELKVSARLMDGERVVAQRDDWPVHNAYHTIFWRSGEQVADVYDIALPREVRPGSYGVLLIVYHADTGAEVGRIDGGAVTLQ